MKASGTTAFWSKWITDHGLWGIKTENKNCKRQQVKESYDCTRSEKKTAHQSWLARFVSFRCSRLSRFGGVTSVSADLGPKHFSIESRFVLIFLHITPKFQLAVSFVQVFRCFALRHVARKTLCIIDSPTPLRKKAKLTSSWNFGVVSKSIGAKLGSMLKSLVSERLRPIVPFRRSQQSTKSVWN